MVNHQNGVAKPPASAASAYTINLDNFRKRLKGFYTCWSDHKSDLWGFTDAIAIATPPTSEDLRYLKSSALNIWLLGYEFPETIMVFMNKQIHFLCSQKKAKLLETTIKSAREAVGVDLTIHVKAKDNDGTSLMEEIIGSIHTQSKSESPIVGYISKEAPEGKLLETWSEKLANSNLQLTDVTNGFSELFSIKDGTELICIKEAAHLTTSVMKIFVVPKLERVIDEEKKVSHSSLMDDAEKAVLNPARVKVELKAEDVDICYPPIFQSGGQFDLRPNAASNDDDLYYNSTSVIICAIGSRYNSYCSNIARTFLIDATETQRKAYEVLLKAHDAAVGALKPGNIVGAVYQAALSVIQKEAPELLPNLTKSAGTGIGLEFRESGLSLNSKNDRVLKSGMVFNVSLGFQNLQARTKNPKTEKYSLLLADTVIVGKKPPEVLTAGCSKAVKDVAYSFSEEEDEEPLRVRSDLNGTGVLSSKATLRSDKQEMSKEELRRQHQAELARQKNEEIARRLAGSVSAAGEGRGPAKTSSELIAYKNVNDIPFAKQLAIQVDPKNEAVLLPIYGSMVPFHVSTVKSVTSHQDHGTCTIRVIFYVPGTPFNPHDANTLKFQGSIYLKEITFRSKDSRHISEVVQQIKTLRRQVSSRESERAERATLVTQERLQLAGNRMKPIKLPDLWIRPAFVGRGRKLTGSLEAHVNGFRYATSKPDERVDVMFANIKHAFFQPAEKEMITLLHFHLHNHIMVGNKKTKDIQFYVEVMDVVQTLGGGRRSALDPDEIEEEQRERDRKNKINMDFQSFVNKVHDIWAQPQFKGLDLEFDMPLRELGFYGVPHKSSAFIVPTSSCLVELIETPFLVVSLGEVEIVNLERIGFGQKNVDMAIVFKDFKRDVLRIDSIPSSSLDGIKEWLDMTDLKYYESRLNLNWRPILKTITEDPEKFIEDGGWEFLNMDASESDSDNTEESDKGYEPSDVEPESASEDEDSASESLVESDEDDEEEESSEDSEEEKGKTWEELEREASNADRDKGDESDSEEEKRRRKVKVLGKSHIPERSAPKRMLPSKRPKFKSLQCVSFSLKRRTKSSGAVKRADESLLYSSFLQTSQGLNKKLSWYVSLPIRIGNLVGFHAKIHKCLGWQEGFKHYVSIFLYRLLISAMLVISLSVTINKTPALALTEENLLFLEAWRAVDRAYVDKTFNGQSWFRYRESALHKAIKKMLSTLDDPFTRFLEPEKFKSLRSGTQGALTGVGLSIGYPLVVDGTPSGLVVVSSAPGGPANKAGILSGDIILAIDGESTEDMDIYDAADRLQGTEGSVVKLVICRGIETKKVNLRREKVKFSPVKSRLCEVSRSGTEKSMVGYIKLTSFNQNASGEVKNAIDTLRSNGVKAFVLDLRNNSGGLFPEGIEISKICKNTISKVSCDLPSSTERYKHFKLKEIMGIPSEGSIQDSAMSRNMPNFNDPLKIIAKHNSQIPCKDASNAHTLFCYCCSVIGKIDGRLFVLDKGVIVYICDNRGVRDIYEADGSNSVAVSEPLAVLCTLWSILPLISVKAVNKGTASASEILAGALKDNKRAVLFGEPTFGKGKIQSVFELSDGSGLIVTVARYETPAHTNIDKVGIIPDHPLPTPFPEDEDEFCSCLVNPSSPCNLNPAQLFSG
ncbi:hypothetical protein ZIOFF_061865 [Zingiber officinale]|uniref:FACT complex subunit n=2 Tax=Zingiber officinale TaxID=94328 RepID=A0A8J5KIQ6_ZINOF|nr:hypothetical protein ZIOFF_061865 [Zingiber officinale]